MGLYKTGVGTQQSPNNHLSLGHLMAPGTKKMPGYDRRGNRFLLTEQELVCIGPELFEIA